jgi:hypothetical protein
MRLSGIVQKAFKVQQGSDQEVRLTSMGSVAMAQTELPQVELARIGRMFKGGTGIIANGIAPVAAIPTTTATLALYNGEPDTGRTLFIDALSFALGSGTPAAGAALFAAVSNGKLATAVAAMATGYGVGPTTGLTKHKSAALFGAAITFPAGTVWDLVGASQQLAAANVGQGDQPFELRGSIAVPPGYALGLAILSGAGTTPLYMVGARWAEIEVDLDT